MKIRIVAVSKTKDKYIQEGEREYVKRLGPVAEVELTTVKEEKIAVSFQLLAVRNAEGARILKQIPKDYFVVALDMDGKELSSPEFAKLIEEVRDFKGGKLCFIIGGPVGLSEEVLDRADLKLSLSKMTLTHQMIRLVLLEQIYRGFEILRGSGYHK